MMRGLFVLSVLALVCLPAAASASAPSPPPSANGLDLPIEGAITRPDWLRKPSGAEFADAYPFVAQALSIGGQVTLDCEVTSSGELADCKVIHERPFGMGFGAAALSMTPEFKMTPETVDGARVSGARVAIPINFAINSDGLPESVPTKVAIKNPSPEALALARRIIAATGKPIGLPTDFAAYVYAAERDLRRATNEQSDTVGRRAVLDAMTEALRAAAPKLLEARAMAYAQTYPAAELKKMAEFFESPAGRDWADHRQAIDDLETNGARDALKSVSVAARQLYCASRACGDSATPSTDK